VEEDLDEFDVCMRVGSAAFGGSETDDFAGSIVAVDNADGDAFFNDGGELFWDGLEPKWRQRYFSAAATSQTYDLISGLGSGWRGRVEMSIARSAARSARVLAP
jgi:hypothetical protein